MFDAAGLRRAVDQHGYHYKITGNIHIHVLIHTFHYGGGDFEGERFYKTDKGPAVFRLKEHTDRLFRSAEAFEMKIPFSKEEINKAILETIINIVKFI